MARAFSRANGSTARSAQRADWGAPGFDEAVRTRAGSGHRALLARDAPTRMGGATCRPSSSRVSTSRLRGAVLLSVRGGAPRASAALREGERSREPDLARPVLLLRAKCTVLNDCDGPARYRLLTTHPAVGTATRLPGLARP